MRLKRFHHGNEFRVDEQSFILGIVDDETHLFRKQFWVDRVADPASAGNGIVQFEMPVVVPGQGANSGL